MPKRRRRRNPVDGFFDVLKDAIGQAFQVTNPQPGQTLTPPEFELYKELLNAGRKICLARYHPDNKETGDPVKYDQLDQLCRKVMPWK